MPVSTRSRTRGPRPAPHYVYDDDSLDSSVERKPVRKPERKPAVKEEVESSDDESWAEQKTAVENRSERMRLRPWLEHQINQGQCSGLQWLDRSNKIVKIPWKHASRHGWRLGDACLFQRWAVHSGKYRENMRPNPKRWKANFRCALNSLADIKEVKQFSQKRGSNAFKVYQLLPFGRKGQTACNNKIKKSNSEKTALRTCDVNMLPVTIMDLEKNMKDEEIDEDTEDMKKKPKRRQSRQNSRRTIKKEVHNIDDQQVPDVQDDYGQHQLHDHDSYTASKMQGGPLPSLKLKLESHEALESCNGGYKFNGSPTSDFRMDFCRQLKETSPENTVDVYDEDEDGSDVLTDEQVINEVIEMESSCSNTSDSEPFGFDGYPSSPSSVCDWMTSVLPQPTSPYAACSRLPYSVHYHHHRHVYSPHSTNYFVNRYYHQTQKSGQWNEDLTKANPFLNGFQDDCVMPCVTQVIPSVISENGEKLEWHAAGLNYQDL
ncbi:interferon regulatory factor 1-like isoform X2 [Lineus longissimus]